MRKSVVGLDSLLKKLNKLGGNVDDVLYKSVNKNVKMVQAEAKTLCTVDTGELRNSIISSTKKTDKGIFGVVSTNKEYATYIEFGTGQVGKSTNTNTNVDVSYKEDWVGKPAQPFLYPALKNNEERVIDNIKEDVEKELRRLSND